MALLDTVSGAYVAYGLRKLRNAYSGYAVTVRRSSDNAVLDVGFTAEGEADIAAIEAWSAGSNVFVTTWYDQSGGAGNAVQATAGSQPQIAINGVVYRDSENRPRLYFNSSSLVATASVAVNNQNLTSFFVQEANYDTSYNVLLGLGSPIYYYLQYNTGQKQTKVQYISDGTSAAAPGDVANTQQPAWRTIQILDLNGATIRYWRNRDLKATQTNTKSAASSTRVQLGSFIGYISEVILFTHLSDADRLAAYTDLNTYYLTGPTSVNESALLPQSWQWHVDLYDWLETISIEDVSYPLGSISWDGTYANTEALSRLWLTMNGGKSEYITSSIVRADPDWFVLDAGNGKGIEATGTVRIHQSSADAAFWYTQNLALAGGGQGNPHYQSTTVGLRGLISIAVDMIMHDDLADTSPQYWSLVDFAGGAMNSWIWAYNTFKHLVSAEVRAAFEAGFEYIAWKLWKWGAHDINGNMDTKAIAALANVYALSSNEEAKEWCIKGAKKILFGSETGTPETTNYTAGLYRKPGFVDEGDSPETTYNGVSLYHMLEAYSVLQESLNNSPPMYLIFSAGGQHFAVTTT